MADFCRVFIRPSLCALIRLFITRRMCVFAQVVVMNGCASLFSCIAAVVCDPKGKFKNPQTLHLPPVNANVCVVTERNEGIFILTSIW